MTSLASCGRAFPVMERRMASPVGWGLLDEENVQAALDRSSISAEDVRETFAADQRGFGVSNTFCLATMTACSMPCDRARESWANTSRRWRR